MIVVVVVVMVFIRFATIGENVFRTPVEGPVLAHGVPVPARFGLGQADGVASHHQIALPQLGIRRSGNGIGSESVAGVQRVSPRIRTGINGLSSMRFIVDQI